MPDRSRPKREHARKTTTPRVLLTVSAALSLTLVHLGPLARREVYSVRR